MKKVSINGFIIMWAILFEILGYFPNCFKISSINSQAEALTVKVSANLLF